jgi:hypothetical protein
MKKTSYITGLISSLFIYLGAMFKIQHWPGASVMLVLGIACLVFLFVPIALMEHYKTTDERKNNWLHIIAFVTSFLVFTGALFKILHWPYAGVILIFSIPMPFILFLPVFLNTSNRNKAPISDYVGVLSLLLFYALFCSLMALGTSKNILDEGSVSAREWMNIENVYRHSLVQSPANPSGLPAANLKDIQNIQATGDKLCDEISGLVNYVAIYASENNRDLSDKEGNIDFEHLNRIDALIRGVDIYRNEGQGVELMKHLREYQNLLVNAEGLKASPVKELAQKMLDTSPSGEETWEEMHLFNLPLTWEISSLHMLKTSVRVCQSEAINFLIHNAK